MPNPAVKVPPREPPPLPLPPLLPPLPPLPPADPPLERPTLLRLRDASAPAFTMASFCTP